MIENFLICIMYLISVALGCCAVVLYGYMPLKSFGDFGKLCLYLIGLYVGLKLVVRVVCLILKRAFSCDYDCEERKIFSIIYFIVSFVGTMICGYIETKSIFLTIVGMVCMFLYNLFPLLFEISIGAPDSDYHSNDVKLNNSSDKYDIKSGYVTDQFGNIKAKSTTYIDGDIKKTYVTDNLGNTIAESTTIGNHTTTKIK